MGFLPRQQCRKAPASAAEKGHILELLIKPQRLPCFKSKLYLGYKKDWSCTDYGDSSQA